MRMSILFPNPHSSKEKRVFGGSPFLLWGTLSILLCVGLFAFATMANPIDGDKKVSVDGVLNTTQYLTSLVLHTPGQNGGTVILKYDTGANALHIKGSVNADALLVGNSTSSAGNGSAILGGDKNKNDAENSLIVGGASNTIQKSSSNSIIVGGNSNTILNAKNSAIISSNQTTFPFNVVGEKKNVVVIGGDGNKIQGSFSTVIGAGENVVGNNSVLIGKKIKAGDKDNIFVWSNGEDFTPTQSSAFYINGAKVGVNTNNPLVKVDMGQGALKIKDANKLVQCDANLKGTMAYVSKGNLSAMCGCNGYNWVPLSSDPVANRLCNNSLSKTCEGLTTNAEKDTATVAYPRWDPKANGGSGGWKAIHWTYGGIPALQGNNRECSYVCKKGFHPGVDNPTGWQQGGCKACTQIANQYNWRTAGTGTDNCDFSCKGGYFYTNAIFNRACKTCVKHRNASYNSKDLIIAGKKGYDHAWRSPDDNQLIACHSCTNKPPSNASYISLNVSGTNGDCPWVCDDGYNKVGNSCSKAEWKEVIGQNICKNTGKWKDAYRRHTFECRDTKGNLVAAKVCNIWFDKPSDRNEDIEDLTCNTPSPVGRDWVCNVPNCNGKCSRDHVKVTCFRYIRDKAGNVYDIEHKQQLEQCQNPCDDGQCGSANGVAVKTKPTTNLCANGSTSTTIQGNGPWTWNCKGKNGSTACQAPKDNSVNGQCDNYQITQEGGKATSGKCNSGTPSGFAVGTNGWTWDCKGSDGGRDARNCSATCGNGLVFKNGKCENPVQPENGVCQSAVVESHGNTMQGPGTCKAGTPSGFAVGTNGWTWDCKGLNGGTSDSCSGTCTSGLSFRKNGGSGICLRGSQSVSCGGTKPTGEGIKFGAENYTQTLQSNITSYSPNKTWTHTTNANLGACEYTCKSGYTSQAGKCVKVNYTCTGPTPANARLIPGDDKELTANTPKKVVDRNTSAKCEYACNSGYENKNGSCVKKLEPKCGAKAYTCEVGEVRPPAPASNFCSPRASCWECQKGSSSVSCKINPTYSCTGPTPANARLIPGDDKELTANTPKKVVDRNTSAKCEYTCYSGYENKNGSCVKKLEPKCGAKAYTCEVGEVRPPAPASNFCSPRASCWECQKGSSSVFCKINPTYSCTGKDPSNATLVPGDDKGLTKNTEKKLVSKNTSAKCEYTCNEGYRFTPIFGGGEFCLKNKVQKNPIAGEIAGCPKGQKQQYYTDKNGISFYRCVPNLPDFPSECKENPACGKVEHGVTGPCYCTKKYSDETNIDNDISRHREGGRGLDPDSNGGPHNTTSTLRP